MSDIQPFSEAFGWIVLFSPVVAGLLISALWVVPITIWRMGKDSAVPRAWQFYLLMTAPWAILYPAAIAGVLNSGGTMANSLALVAAVLCFAVPIVTVVCVIYAALQLSAQRWIAWAFGAGNIFISVLCWVVCFGLFVIAH